MQKTVFTLYTMGKLRPPVPFVDETTVSIS